MYSFLQESAPVEEKTSGQNCGWGRTPPLAEYPAKPDTFLSVTLCWSVSKGRESALS